MMKRDGIEQDGQSEKVKKTLRGRAEKACVRCRAKKRTCDAGNPCLRCKESHSACYFSDWHYTVPYPREYVEYLEEQQEQLSTGLMTMYRILKESNIQTIPALPDKPQAQDLLAALKGLKLNSQSPQLVRSGTAVDGLRHGNGIPVEELPTPFHKEYPGSMPSSMHHPPSTLPHLPTSAFIPHFGAAPVPHLPNMTANQIYPAAPYRPFEYAQPMHQHVQAPQGHGFSHAQPARHDFEGALQMPEAWHPPPTTLAPSTNAPHQSHSDHTTPLASSPDMFPHSHHASAHMQPNHQHDGSQAWLWGIGPEAGVYAHRADGRNDARTGQDRETIEQRGDSLPSHDS